MQNVNASDHMSASARNAVDAALNHAREQLVGGTTPTVPTPGTPATPEGAPARAGGLPSTLLGPSSPLLERG